MDRMRSPEKRPEEEIPTKTSAPRTTCSNPPVNPSGLVRAASSSWT